MIYEKLKSGAGLDILKTTNSSKDEQLELDVFADHCFQQNIATDTKVKYILSEERPDLVQYGDGKYSLALDPLDGSKAAVVGIPSGAIFGIFKDAEVISDFNGSNIVCGGFFVFGINLEVYLTIDGKASKGIWNSSKKDWDFAKLDTMPFSKMFAINASNRNVWDHWLQKLYDDLMNNPDSQGKTFNTRWYASLVSEIKRLVIKGGLFSYPTDSRIGYAKGHLRLVYEAIPMAYLIKSLGGSSSDGKISILEKEVSQAHEKTPLFLGNEELIELVHKSNS